MRSRRRDGQEGPGCRCRLGSLDFGFAAGWTCLLPSALLLPPCLLLAASRGKGPGPWWHGPTPQSILLAQAQCRCLPPTPPDRDVHRLVFPAVGPQHAGVYKSVIANKLGKAACYAHLYVTGEAGALRSAASTA